MTSLIARVVPKSSLNPHRICPPPLTKKQEKTLKEPLIQLMQKRQEEAGASWPQNLRIEPVISRRKIGNAPKSLRSTLKKMLTER
ncbi:hypothetical protein JVT61DRAFT_2771 [Boletus reticuloceps]|uniref:Uncharacterized protein n=1 Tax=Boletus reticuloceps TaxID=495285 RepID=A0A8I3AA45_9AGAM|nr:hypothetical protein JVT61DRAFT_2771 [Boletus reticuloceps]